MNQKLSGLFELVAGSSLCHDHSLVLSREFFKLAASKPADSAPRGLIAAVIGDCAHIVFARFSAVISSTWLRALLLVCFACDDDGGAHGWGAAGEHARVSARPSAAGTPSALGAGAGAAAGGQSAPTVGASGVVTSGGAWGEGGRLALGGEAALGGESAMGGETARGGNSSGGSPTCEPLGSEDACGLTRFAVFGDYGSVGPAAKSVSELVKSWHVDFIATAGDNNYPVGGADTIDANIGQFYAEFICPYRGSFGRGATKNRFFPALGNHDWYTAQAQPYLDYFDLPGNERYYDFAWGSVQLFMLDSDPSEPDGVMSDSRQATWLSERLAASTARWKIVVMHHPPFSSALHGSTFYMQWPYKQWGADLVFAGHDHDYERIEVDGLPFIVAGLGGASTYGFNTTVSGSRAQYNAGYGAGLVEADAQRLSFRFFDSDGQLIDTLSLGTP